MTEGHAINAFETTDLGLVYIDCTGRGLWDESQNRSSWDRRARLEIKKPYVVADIDKAKTHFKFLICQLYNANLMHHLKDLQFEPYVTDGQVLRRLEELGWIQADPSGLPSEENVQNFYKMIEWLRIHNIEEMGLKWIQEWIQEHQVELYGRDFEPYEYFEDTIGLTSSEKLVSAECWYILVDCLDTSWFQPVEKLIDVDGIPIVWKIVWEMKTDLWSSPFGNKVVKDIHIYW
jgi:hypothetical protein